MAALFCICLLLVTQTQISFAQETFQLKIPQTTVSLTGFTRPKVEVTVGSEVAGRCLTVSGDVGDIIKESRPLIQIDPTFIRLDLATNGLAQEKLKKTIAFNNQELKRYKKLLTNKSVSQTRLDQAQLQYDLSVIELENLVTNQQRLQERLTRHTIQPVAGFQIMERYVDPGEMISTGQPLAKIGNFQELVVPFTLSFSEYQQLKTASPIPLSLPEANLTLEAEILRTTPGFDDKSRKIKADLIIPAGQVNKLDSPRGGIRAVLQLVLPDRKGGYIVPATAVQERHNFFWLTRDDGAKRKVVLLGKASLDNHVLVSGDDLVTGEKYLSRPIH